MSRERYSHDSFGWVPVCETGFDFLRRRFTRSPRLKGRDVHDCMSDFYSSIPHYCINNNAIET
jgi:hypothetical protein